MQLVAYGGSDDNFSLRFSLLWAETKACFIK